MEALAIDRINAVSPYKVSLAGEREYKFTTDRGIHYRVGFLEDESLTSCETYQFYITKETLRHSSKDEKVRPTVLCVLEEFFCANESVLLYMCDTSDGKESLRSRLFLSWFRTYEMEAKYICRDAHLEVEGIGMYAAIIFRRDNPLSAEINEEFDETLRVLANKPV